MLSHCQGVPAVGKHDGEKPSPPMPAGERMTDKTPARVIADLKKHRNALELQLNGADDRAEKAKKKQALAESDRDKFREEADSLSQRVAELTEDNESLEKDARLIAQRCMELTGKNLAMGMVHDKDQDIIGSLFKQVDNAEDLAKAYHYAALAKEDEIAERKYGQERKKSRHNWDHWRVMLETRPRKDVISNYRQWCAERDIPPVGERTFDRNTKK
jgi:hypothetical protein